MDNSVKLEITGDKNSKGEITGTGSLLLHLSDTDNAKVSVDYSDKDKVILNVSSQLGFKIAPQSSLTLSGDINKNLMNDEITGNVNAKFIINQDIAAKIEQSFAKGDNKTSLTVSINL